MFKSFIALLGAGLICASAEAQNFNFVSFNTIADGQRETFERYSDTIAPIMHRHGAHYIQTELVEVLAGEERAQVINIGDMGTPEQAQAFFSDPDFLEAFPTLIGALRDHLTLAPAGPLPDGHVLAEGDLLLLVATDDAHVLGRVSHRDGSEMLGHWDIGMANRGLGPTASAETAPATLAIWRLSGPVVVASDVEGATIAVVVRVQG